MSLVLSYNSDTTQQIACFRVNVVLFYWVIVNDERISKVPFNETNNRSVIIGLATLAHTALPNPYCQVVVQRNKSALREKAQCNRPQNPYVKHCF